MANPRKFSEKIALHNQKQAEETAAFERIMQEVSVTREILPPPRTVTQLQPHPPGYLRHYLGGSLPNVNQIAINPQMELHHPQGFDDGKYTMRHPARFDTRMRPYAYVPRRGVLPLEMNHHRVHMDVQSGQYPGSYLSPPPESNWRRTNSDSALHQSVMNPSSQEQFSSINNPMLNQARRDFNETSLNCMPPSYKSLLDNKKFEQHFQGGSRPKSCEATNARHGADGTTMHVLGNGTVSAAPISHGLSHITQIGNNTGSLPDLTNIPPPPLLNPIDYDDPQPHTGGGQTTIYNQAHNPSNIPTASPHMPGLSRVAASPSRSRRHTHNGPSPLSLGSPEHTRRIKFPNTTSPKGASVKPELQSPPVGGSYPYSYNQPGPQAGGTSASLHQQQLAQTGTQLRIDINAASQVGHPPPSYTRAPPAASVTSPLTSPTSPTCQANYSPVTSPRHKFTTGSNPALSEAYYRNDMSAIHPLQQQFEHFHVVNDNSSNQHHSRAPPTYSMLSALSENWVDGVYDHGHSGALLRHLQGGNGAQSKHSNPPNSINKIPDIVFTGVDDPHSSKSGGFLGVNDFAGVIGHDLGSEYFSSDDLKTNLGLEELQMLDEPNIIHDPAMEDSLRLDSV